MYRSDNKISIASLPVWERAKEKRVLLSMVMDLTARCNNDCVHCYINRPAHDRQALEKELTLDEIKAITAQAVDLGVLWILLSGGEPLLRPDFSEIYTHVKTRGVFVSVFTNASLVTDEHIRLFKKYPPREIEVSVYGTTPEIHKSVVRKNTFESTMTGINRLLSAGLPVTLKSTIMQANFSDFDDIANFCRSKTSRLFRFDPCLQLRADRDPHRNKSILSQRLTPEQIAALDKKDPQRYKALEQGCKNLDNSIEQDADTLFKCQAGINTCAIGWDGKYQLCPSLVNRNCTLDLKTHTLAQAWNHFSPEILKRTSVRSHYTETCGTCTLHDICAWCPAHADLETGQLDGCIPYFCKVAKERQRAWKKFDYVPYLKRT
ncbi:radical SAM protein [Desulfobacter curvatus]|uniref:radical SAM protein n=1 Tax=Desulfobacter curvatus TaxID=2290 RepID=UPI00039D9CAF|nr:radical SAM protein [Desulfobacter curvatus]